MMFAIKQFVGALLSPLTIALFALLLAGLCRFSRRTGASRFFIATGAAIGYLGSLVPCGDLLLRRLEDRYPPLSAVRVLPAGIPVVVLGSGYAPRKSIPVTAALDTDGLMRAVEGIRLWRHFRGGKLVMSGGAPPGFTPVARGYAKLAIELGVDRESIVVLDSPRDTASEAREVAALFGDKPFLLVTSASHMPRAMQLMAKSGAQPIPAPTAQFAGGWPGAWLGLLPSSAGLRKSERALHEYMGLAVLAVGIN